MNLEQVKKAKEGDVEETAKIILENTKSMYRVAFSILKNEEEIYDAISNTTVIVFEKISTLRKEEFFKTWLTRILINECYKIYNQNKKIVYLETATQDSLKDLAYNDTYTDFETRNLVKKLSPDFRETVMLYYFEDFSVKEIAEILNIAEGTVKSRLARARKELEKQLLQNELEKNGTENVPKRNGPSGTCPEKKRSLWDSRKGGIEMNDNELDKILKEKLNSKIEPSAEFEKKVAEMVNKERDKKLETKFKQVKAEQERKELVPKRIKSRAFKITSILSVAAAFILVFTLGMNVKTTEIIGKESNANLISIKAIEPTNLESGVISKDSEFIIEAEGENLNTEIIRKSVYVEPALDYTIEKTINKNEYKLKFTQNLPENTIVKLQYVKNKITKDSWAYQTSNKFTVVSTYPDNDAEDVSKNSTIEIRLSYANIEDLEKYVKISPAVEGKWEHLGKIWRFTPNKALSKDTKYKVTISKALSVENQKLEQDYKFEFTVGYTKNVEYRTATFDQIITSKPDEQTYIEISNDTSTKIKFGKTSIEKFAGIDDFIQYVQNDNIENTTKLNDIEVEEAEFGIKLKQNLQTGFYIARIKDEKGKELFNCPIQISEISAYAMETERDVLVWTAKGNELAQDIEVEYNEKKEKTDKNGIAKFTNITDESEELKYAKISNELVVGIYNYESTNYPRGYIYTDRPLYKNTDTINIWGFVPKEFFYGKVEDEFYIELGNEEKHKIELQKDGTFSDKIELKNHMDTQDMCISLYYKDSTLANRYIAIKNYELQNYTYEVITDKDYGYIGEEYKFDVKVSHITGLVVPNKTVRARYNDSEFAETTGTDGIAHFRIKLEKSKYEQEQESGPNYDGVQIFNGDQVEYTDAETWLAIARFNRNVNTDTNYEKNSYKSTLYKLEKTKNIKMNEDIKKLYTGTFETNVDIFLEETTETRVLDGTEYNEFTKQNEPKYNWVETKNTQKLKTVKSKNGIVEINKNEIKTKKNTEEKTYTYKIQLVYKDQDGKQVKDNIYLYNEYETSYGRIGYWDNQNIGVWNRYYNKVNYQKYYTYRYLLKDEIEKFNIGDIVNFSLAEATAKGIDEIQNTGKLLTIKFKENIARTEILTDSKFDYKFTEEDFPGVNFTSAYFINGHFYRMPAKYFDFDEQSKKVDIEISTDKEVYGPKDKVTVTVKTTNNGKPVKSTVNLSIVNEAVFAVEEDRTGILDAIYENKEYPVYTYSTYEDTLKLADGGKGGGDGSPRGEFADTAHFETINTGNDGTATCTFNLPENVTTYRITAQSANEDLQLGENTKQITSKLDFFVQSVEPRGIKTSDDVVLNATSIAKQKYDVNYEFTIKELNKTLTAKSQTNAMATVNFGNLPFGTYTAIIKGTYGEKQDSIQYTFNVKEATQEVKNKTITNIQNNTTIKPTKNPIVLELYRQDMSNLVKYIDFIESTATERLDTQIAYNKAQELKNAYYNEKNSINRIPMSLYEGNRGYLKNLRSGKEDLVLTALTTYYAKDYCNNIIYPSSLDKKENIFEYYLIEAARGEAVLKDLLYLKQEKDISNYNKLLVTLGLEFVGDYKNAKSLYNIIELTEQEEKEYKSIIAIIETFIAKEKSVTTINELIANNPADEYLRYAILSYFQNNETEIEKEETVKAIYGNKEETITLNGMKVETLTLNNEDLTDIRFETTSQDIMVSYYYQTALENISDKNISKDMKISITDDLKVGKEATLSIKFNNDFEGEVRIALPNSLRLAQKYADDIDSNSKYYIQSNNIDYITLYKTKKCKTIKLPLLVITEGKYKFENIVCQDGGKYHISNSLNLKINK